MVEQSKQGAFGLFVLLQQFSALSLLCGAVVKAQKSEAETQVAPTRGAPTSDTRFTIVHSSISFRSGL